MKPLFTRTDVLLSFKVLELFTVWTRCATTTTECFTRIRKMTKVTNFFMFFFRFRSAVHEMAGFQMSLLIRLI